MKNIEKKAIYNWLIKRTFWVAVFYALTHLYVAFVTLPEQGLWIALLVLIAIVDALVIVNAYVLPCFQYKKYRYCIGSDQIYLESGVIFKETTVLPIVQLQDVGYSQGPIQMALNLATVHVSTAGSDLAIEGLSKEDAIVLVDNLSAIAKELVTAKKQEENV